jgi:hypothetical protein
VHQVSDLGSGAAAYFGWMREGPAGLAFRGRIPAVVFDRSRGRGPAAAHRSQPKGADVGRPLTGRARCLSDVACTVLLVFY